MEIKVCKLKEIITLDNKVINVGKDTIEPILPTYGKEGDACMDVYPIYCEYDKSKDRFIYHTGLAFAIGTDTIGEDQLINEMELRPRSNITKSDFYIPNSPGTLDWGYRGELLMVYKNRTSSAIVNVANNLLLAVQQMNFVHRTQGANYYLDKATLLLKDLTLSVTTPPYKCDGIDRCCQLLIRGRRAIEWKEVDTVEELGNTERGTGGFGSTGGGIKDKK